MDNAVIAYVLYLLIAVPLTIWVGSTLSRNGRVFLVDVFDGNDELAEAVNKLLVVGFYLLNLGVVALYLRVGDSIADARAIVEVLSVKMGVVLLMLGRRAPHQRLRLQQDPPPRPPRRHGRSPGAAAGLDPALRRPAGLTTMRTTRIALVGAALWSLALVVGALTVPLYSSDTASGDSTGAVTTTLLHRHARRGERRVGAGRRQHPAGRLPRRRGAAARPGRSGRDDRRRGRRGAARGADRPQPAQRRPVPGARHGRSGAGGPRLALGSPAAPRGQCREPARRPLRRRLPDVLAVPLVARRAAAPRARHRGPGRLTRGTSAAPRPRPRTPPSARSPSSPTPARSGPARAPGSTCLWATVEHRDLATRLSTPVGLPVARAMAYAAAGLRASLTTTHVPEAQRPDVPRGGGYADDCDGRCQPV